MFLMFLESGKENFLFKGGFFGLGRELLWSRVLRGVIVWIFFFVFEVVLFLECGYRVFGDSYIGV